MKIAVVDNLPVGGAKRVEYEELSYLAQHHTIDLYTNDSVSAYPFMDVCEQIVVYDFNPTTRHGIARVLTEFEIIGKMAKSYWEVAQKINQSDAEVVLLHSCMLTEAPMLIPWLNKPSVYFAHEWFRLYYEPELFPLTELHGLKKSYEKLHRWGLARVDAASVRAATEVVTTSQFNHQNFMQAYGRKTEVIPLGVNTQVFKPNPRIKRRHFLLVGNKDHLDGYDFLESAIKTTNAKITIKQAGTDGKTYDANDLEMCRLYQEAVATVCLHHNEPFGLAPIESMACGTPVVAVNEGGYKETVIDGITGFLIERNIPDFLRVVNILARDTQKYEEMSRNSRQVVMDKFTWKNHGKHLEAILNKASHD